MQALQRMGALPLPSSSSSESSSLASDSVRAVELLHLKLPIKCVSMWIGGRVGEQLVVVGGGEQVCSASRVVIGERDCGHSRCNRMHGYTSRAVPPKTQPNVVDRQCGTTLQLYAIRCKQRVIVGTRAQEAKSTRAHPEIAGCTLALCGSVCTHWLWATHNLPCTPH
jgi:hypothetical protein